MSQCTQEKHELIKQHIDSFPVLPAAVTRLMQVINSPESSAQDVVEVILPDQSLCLTVLKIANSVLFGRPQKVESMKMAVSVLGFNEVQRIALSKALVNSFSKLSKQHAVFIDKFWEHSFVCGIAATAISRDLHINPEIAFMGGLIHDIGKLIMLETFNDDYSTESWMTLFGSELLSEELEMFSFTHDLVGGQLLQKWFFPKTLIAAVAYHHHPEKTDEKTGLAYVIQLADLLSFYCCNQESLGDESILTVIKNSLPAMQSHWQNFGLSIENDTIARWFNWLLDNHEQGNNLKEAFSS